MSPFRSICAGTLLTLAFLFPHPNEAEAWQQSVHYRMQIRLITESHSYKGSQQLIYVNNSRDTLTEVYYHLFYNAFKPGSAMDRRDDIPGSGWKGIDRLRVDQQGDVRIGSLRQDGTELAFDVNETVLKAGLAAPLLPGDSTMLQMEWTTQIPRIRRRGGWLNGEGIEYSMSQWYPKLAEYDRNGWHPDEYVDREFYGVFGTFDVEITLPAEYVVGGTGTVTNPDEVRCGYEVRGRDTLILHPASGTGLKTWKFHAENVHDFAWVADREYVHQIVHSNGTPIHLLYQRFLVNDQHITGWNYAGYWTSEILAYFSERFGEYAWPQFTVTQAGDGGMEYPMLIMITGYRGSSSLYRVIAHELGHMWYYGMMANNETQEAWLDEGLTQFLTDEADRGLNGENLRNPYDGITRVVYPWDRSRWNDISPYYSLAITGYAEPLNTFHDRFREGATAAQVYSKGEAVVRQLQYMFGDSLFDAAMRRYYRDWRFRHPSARDFERSMEKASGMRLDWFFNQWIGSTKTCDYALTGLESDGASNGDWQTTIELRNEDEIIMPLDIVLTYADGSTETANIPVEEWKKPGVDRSLPAWFWVDRTYSATFPTRGEVVRAEIDPSGSLLDLDRTNNVQSTALLSNPVTRAHTAFYRRWDLNRPMDRYSIRLRPTLWYSQADGAQVGFLANGGYAYDRYNAELGLYYNVGSGRIDYKAAYDTPVGFLGRLGRISMLGTNSDGIQHWRAELSKEIRPFYYQTGSTHQVSMAADHSRLLGDNYPNAVAPWDSGNYNTLGIGYEWSQGNRWSDRYGLSLQMATSFGSERTFTQWQAAFDWSTALAGLDIETSLFAGTSVGDPPAQYLYNGAGARSTEMHENLIHRFGMNAAPEFAARNHLLLPGQGFLTSLTEADDADRFGRHILNAKIEIGDLNPLSLFETWPFMYIDVKPYAAAGWLFRDNVTFDRFGEISVEAGLVASVDVMDLLFVSREWRDLLDAPYPVRLSFIAPIVAESPFLEETGTAYRWGIGISVLTDPE